MHSGLFAKEHATCLEQNKVAQKIPFYSTAFGLDTQQIGENESSLVGSKCISPWFEEEESKSNQVFISKYQQEFGKKPTPFALLGYENGLILNEGLQNLQGENLNTSHLKNMLNQVSVTGPRGEIVFDTETKRTAFSHYLWEVVKEKNGYKKVKRQEVNLELTTPIFNESHEQVGGWDNAYLCN